MVRGGRALVKVTAAVFLREPIRLRKHFGQGAGIGKPLSASSPPVAET
jgi:hypothetical protein